MQPCEVACTYARPGTSAAQAAAFSQARGGTDGFGPTNHFCEALYPERTRFGAGEKSVFALYTTVS